MSAKLLEGGPIAEQIKSDIKAAIADLPEEQRPCLIAVMVGANPGAAPTPKCSARRVRKWASFMN